MKILRVLRGTLRGGRGFLCVALMLGGGCLGAGAQASSMPSAQVGRDADGGSNAQRGRALLGAMVKALGGEVWLDRKTWIFHGRTTTFYKGQPDGAALQFEEYGRMQPFGERVVMVSHYGPLIATNHEDVADVWTGERGYEITYKGTSPLPAKQVEDFARWRRHSLDAVVKEWLHEPGVLVTYAGSKMVERQLADEVSVIRAGDDGVTLELDQSTHLPLSVGFEWRDPVYKDWNTDVEEFANFHEVQGVMTAYSVTRTHNGDVVGERFLMDAAYNVPVAAEVFDPNQPLERMRK